MHFVDSIECRTTLGIYVHSHTVTYWCLFPIGSMYIYLHLPSFTIKTNHLPTSPMLKTLGLLPFPSPKKTTVKQSPCLESKTTLRIHQAMCTRRSQPALAGKRCEGLAICFSSWWFQPVWKICGRQIGSFPQIGVKLKNIHHHPDSFMKRFRSIVGMASSTIYPPGNDHISYLGKFGKSSTQQCLVGGDMLVPRMVPHWK